MANSVSVEYDTRGLVRALGQLSSGVDRGAQRAGMSNATRTASDIRGNVPVRSGRLRGTVKASSTDDGGDVHYGGTLPYARYIEKRSHAVAGGVARAPGTFQRDCEDVAAREARRV